MFDAPAKTTTYVAPAEAIDVDQRYIFKLVNLVDEGVSKFADPAKNETFHNIRWHFRVAHSTGTQVIMDVDGNPWEHVEWTSSKTGKNPKNGMVAKARLWMEALLGHSVEDDEITGDMPQQIMDKYAAGFFEQKEALSQSGEAYTKLRIMRLSPYKAGAKPEPKPQPKPEPVIEPLTADSIPF